MNQATKLKLSGSTNGKPIQVTGTDAVSNVLIHTATNTANTLDEVWLYANSVKSSGNAIQLTIYTDTDNDANRIIAGIPFRKGLVYIIPGFVYDGGVEIRGYAAEADVINIHGWVNRIEDV
jgi:hypothetical protein